MRARRGGMTLLEVLLALTVGLALLGLLYEVFSAGLRSSEQGAEFLSALRDFNLVDETLRRDVRSVLVNERHPIFVRSGGRELELSVVDGVTVEGLPVVNTVIWRFVPGPRPGPGGAPRGSLLRLWAPGEAAQRAKLFFDDELQDFTAATFARDGTALPPDSTAVPAFLECGFTHARGKLFRPRLHLYSRYARPAEVSDPAAAWLPNHRVHPLPSTFRVITDTSNQVRSVDVSAPRVVGGVLMDTGAMMAAPM